MYIRLEEYESIPHLAPNSLVFMRSGVKFSGEAVVDDESVISANAFEILLVPNMAGVVEAAGVTAGIIILEGNGANGVGVSISNDPRDKRSPDPNDTCAGGAGGAAAA